jgi:hypothetical protein
MRMAGMLLAAMLLAAICLLAAGESVAEDRAFTCPVAGFTNYRDPGLTGTLAVVVRGPSPGAVELHGPWGDIAMPAQTLMIDGDTVAVQATAPVEMRMPDRDAVDACLANKERQKPGILRSRRDSEIIAACLGAAKLTEKPVAVTLSVGLIATDKSEAQLFVTRNYADDLEATANRHQAQTMAKCAPAGS